MEGVPASVFDRHEHAVHWLHYQANNEQAPNSANDFLVYVIHLYVYK